MYIYGGIYSYVIAWYGIWCMMVYYSMAKSKYTNFYHILLYIAVTQTWYSILWYDIWLYIMGWDMGISWYIMGYYGVWRIAVWYIQYDSNYDKLRHCIVYRCIVVRFAILWYIMVYYGVLSYIPAWHYGGLWLSIVWCSEVHFSVWFKTWLNNPTRQ